MKLDRASNPRRDYRVRRAAGRMLRDSYDSLLSKRFGTGDYRAGMEMEFVLSETIIEGSGLAEGELYGHSRGVADFARGKSIRGLLSDDDVGLEELRKIRDYGLTIGKSTPDPGRAYGFLVYILSCARAITRHGDQLDHSIDRGRMIGNLGRAIGNSLVPEEYQDLLKEAREKLEREAEEAHKN